MLTWETKHKFCQCCVGSACRALLEEKKKNLHVALNIKHLLLQLRQKNSQLQLSMTTLHALQAKGNCCCAEFQLPRGMVWEHPAVFSCQKAHWMLRITAVGETTSILYLLPCCYNEQSIAGRTDSVIWWLLLKMHLGMRFTLRFWQSSGLEVVKNQRGDSRVGHKERQTEGCKLENANLCLSSTKTFRVYQVVPEKFYKYSSSFPDRCS